MIKNPNASTLLTKGGAGFVGSSFALFRKARYQGSTVVALDNSKRRGSELDLPRSKAADVKFVHGDVRNASDLLSLPHIDALVECSAEQSVLAGYSTGANYVIDTNLVGTINCLDLVSRDKADVVFLSPSRVYPIAAINDACLFEDQGFRIDPNCITHGLSENGINENSPLKGVRGIYGATKLASELLITEYAHMHGFKHMVDRCGVIDGPWQMGKTDQGSVLLRLARHHWNIPLTYIGFGGKGQQDRDVLHIDDLCDLIALQLEDMDRFNAYTLNVGRGSANSTTLNGFTALAAKNTGRSMDAKADTADRERDLKLCVTDYSRDTEISGWEPQRDLSTIFEDCYAWLVAHEEQLRPILI